MGDQLPFDLTDPTLARAAWSRLAEPGDEIAHALIENLGPSAALDWMVACVRRGSVELPPGSGHHVATSMERALARWSPRLEGLDPRRELDILARLDGHFLTPDHASWPQSINDLGDAAPWCLWVRGSVQIHRMARRSIAVVGARAATSYGVRVAEEFGVGLADRHFAVVSGGAYGIDAAAHRGALAAPGATVAFLAGGVDRLYPAGNAHLLANIISGGGSVVSEVPPGSAPTRVRFLLRNRLIAACANATVVVEAAWRSGSLSTAARAGELFRPVGAVPGPITSVASAGCHRLLRDAAAVCVTDVAEAAELAGQGADVAPEYDLAPMPGDGLDPLAKAVWSALPLRSAASVESIARAAGMSIDDSIACLGLLELSGRAQRVGGGWRKA